MSADALLLKDGAAMACGAAEVRRSQNTCRQGSFLIQSVR